MPILLFTKLIEGSEPFGLTDHFDPFRLDSGGRTGHQDLQAANVTALISTATSTPTGAVSVVVLHKNIIYTVTLIQPVM